MNLIKISVFTKNSQIILHIEASNTVRKISRHWMNKKNFFNNFQTHYIFLLVLELSKYSYISVKARRYRR